MLSPKLPSSPKSNDFSQRSPSVRFLGVNNNNSNGLQPVSSFLSTSSSFSSSLRTPQTQNISVSSDPFAPSNAFSYNNNNISPPSASSPFSNNNNLSGASSPPSTGGSQHQ